eukprot:1310461-Rhodomonas_salina.1
MAEGCAEERGCMAGQCGNNLCCWPRSFQPQMRTSQPDDSISAIRRQVQSHFSPCTWNAVSGAHLPCGIVSAVFERRNGSRPLARG